MKNSDTLIGTICLWNIEIASLTAEIGYMLHPDFQGKGMIQEAIPKAIDYGFNEMKLKSIAGGVHKKNIKSIKVLEKSGFIYNGPIEEEQNYISYCFCR